MMPVADAEDVPAVQHEHLVGDLDVPHAVLRARACRSARGRVRAPEAVAVATSLQPAGLLAALERRLDAAERAVIRAAERGVERRVGLAVAAAEAVPVVGPVARHRQQVPGDARHLARRGRDQRPVGRAARIAVAVAVPQARHAREVRRPAIFSASTSSTSVYSPSPPATKSASSSRSVRSGRAATWPPTQQHRLLGRRAA